MLNKFIGIQAFSRLAVIEVRAAQQALAKCCDGGTWRGAALKVITERGAGGNAGLRYLVAVDSLPADLRVKLADAPDDEPDTDADTMAELPYLSERQCNQAQLRRDIVRIAKLIGAQEAAKIEWRTQYGMRRFGKTAIYRWMQLEEEGGVLALISQARSDRGARRYHVSRAFDGAFTGTATQLQRIQREVETLAKSLYASNLKASEAKVTRACSALLLQHAFKAGLKGDETALKRVCHLSGDWAARFAVKKHLATYDKDRKDYSDKSKPRITRGIDGTIPADVVYGDVHPADFSFVAADGTDIRVRVIAWQDHATRRMNAYPVFFTSGRGVRQGDIVESFIALTQDPFWGMPKTLYLDNGGEYNCLDAITDAMTVSGWPEKARPIVKAMPYNGAAKGSIESAFRTLELSFAAIPGWIGGDRMKKKTHSEGKTPDSVQRHGL